MIIVLDKKLFKYQTKLSENIYVDQNGYLVCEGAILGRIGTQQYLPREIGLTGSEPIDVYRFEDEIFKDESMESLEGRPLTLNHPRELVNVENHKTYAKGEVYNVRREGDNLVGDIRVFDKKVIDIILEKQMRELSLGYTMDIEYDEEKNIYFVKNIVYNHIALVKKGRAGNARINDSVEIIDEEKEEREMENQELKLTNEQLADIIKGAVGQAVGEAVKPLQEKFSAMETSVNERFTKMEEAQRPIVVEPKVEPKVETPMVETKVEQPNYEELVAQAIKTYKEQEAKAQAEAQEPVASFKVETKPKEVDRDLQVNNYFGEFAKLPNESENDYTQRINNLAIHEPIKKTYEKELLKTQQN